ncbi:MAG: type II toxin-antitoxin system HicB family antitoxin [Pseudonocardiaceae bacterium]
MTDVQARSGQVEEWPALRVQEWDGFRPADHVQGVVLGVMGTSRNLTAAVHQEEDWYVAQCLEVDVASQGRTIDEALSNLAEAVELYLEEVDDPQRHVTAAPLVTSFQVPGAA